MNDTSSQSICNKAQNPFSVSDEDRHQIWNILMRNDFEAFVAGDWSMVEGDFWEEGFHIVDARNDPDPSNWRLAYPDLPSYREEWLRQTREFASTHLAATTVLQFLYDSTRLDDIEFNGTRAIARKKFDGQASTTDGREIVLRFQSLYQLVRRGERWLIEGAVGYLPNPMPSRSKSEIKETPW